MPGKIIRRGAAIVLGLFGVALMWGAGDTLFSDSNIAARDPLLAGFLLLAALLIAGSFLYMAYGLWFATVTSHRIRFLGSYFVSVFLLLGFLLPMGDEAWAGILLISYGVVTAAALLFPERYCTVLKGVSLAGAGGLLPFAIGSAFDLAGRIFH